MRSNYIIYTPNQDQSHVHHFPTDVSVSRQGKWLSTDIMYGKTMVDREGLKTDSYYSLLWLGEFSTVMQTRKIPPQSPLSKCNFSRSQVSHFPFMHVPKTKRYIC